MKIVLSFIILISDDHKHKVPLLLQTDNPVHKLFCFVKGRKRQEGVKPLLASSG